MMNRDGDRRQAPALLTSQLVAEARRREAVDGTPKPSAQSPLGGRSFVHVFSSGRGRRNVPRQRPSPAAFRPVMFC